MRRMATLAAVAAATSGRSRSRPRGERAGATPSKPRTDTLLVKARNVGTVTVHPDARASRAAPR